MSGVPATASSSENSPNYYTNSSSNCSEIEPTIISAATSDTDCNVSDTLLSKSVPVLCPLCKQENLDPRVLSCFHCFCASCLTKAITDTGWQRSISCPLCKRNTSCTEIAHLPVDLVIRKAANNSDLSDRRHFGQECRSCRPEPGDRPNAAISCCQICRYLCNKCTNAHKSMNMFKEHVIKELVPAQQYIAEQVDRCPSHPTEKATKYCNQCEVMICDALCSVLHSQHMYEVEDLDSVGSNKHRSLKNLQSSIHLRLNEFKSADKYFQHSHQRFLRSRQQAVEDADAIIENVKQMLEKQKERLVIDVKAYYDEKSDTLTAAHKEIQSIGESACMCTDFIERQLAHGTLRDLLKTWEWLNSAANRILTTQMDTSVLNECHVELVTNSQAVESGVRNLLGYPRFGVELGKITPIARPSTRAAALNNAVARPLNRLPSPATDFDCLKNGCGFDDLQDGVHSWKTMRSNSLAVGTDHDLDSIISKLSIPSHLGHQESYAQTRNADGLEECYQECAAAYALQSSICRDKMIYHNKFGEFGINEGQFTEPSGVAVNREGDIIVADTNNHRIQVFDREGRFKFQFGQCGKRDGQLLYPNRVAVVMQTGDIVVTERSPTHQVQIFNQYGQFVRKFGANILQHPRGVAVDYMSRIVIVECKVMRVVIFDLFGNVINKFNCSRNLEFPNSVVVNDREEIFISDNRAHCIKVFSYAGTMLRQIGGEGISNYPIGVVIDKNGFVLIADNHNNFNITIFTQGGEYVRALESKVKHAQCFDVALLDDNSIALASKDYRIYLYRYSTPGVGNIYSGMNSLASFLS